MKKASIAIALLVSVWISGCSSVPSNMKPFDNISQWNPLTRNKQKGKKKPLPPPETMAVIWKDNTLKADSGLIIRGFEGRVSFHDAKNEPVKVEGDLIVYGFDDTEATPVNKSRTPQKKFVISAEELEANYYETSIGHSYRVWIPWEPAGGYRKSITLIPIFKPVDGQIVRSGSSINVLPGKSPNSQANKKAGDNRQSTIAQAGFVANSESGSQMADQAFMEEGEINQPRMRTTTIPLVPTLSSRLSLPQHPESQVARQAQLKKQGSEMAESSSIPTSAKSRPASDSANDNNSSTGSSSSNSGRSFPGAARPVFGQPGAIK